MELDLLGRNAPPAKGLLRMLRIPFYDSMNWIHRDLMYHDFTFRGWMKYIDDLEKPIFELNPSIHMEPFPYKEGDIPHPYCHRHIAAGIFRGIVMWNIRMRWICRKWIHRIRSKIVTKRVIGETDIVTLEPIPDSHIVRVKDYKSRSTYLFHSHSIQKLLREALLFQTFGISSPIRAKNPYTNIPWTMGQIIVLMDQVQECVWRERHRFVNPLLQWFREAGYCLKQLQKNHSQELQLLAAASFFKDLFNPDVQEITEEVLMDILEEIGMPKDGRVFQYVSKRSVQANLQRQWDSMVMCFWMYQNYRTIIHPDFLVFDMMVQGAKTLYDDTLEWIVSELPKRRVRRIVRRSEPA
jgi:hypothetical protein